MGGGMRGMNQGVGVGGVNSKNIGVIIGFLLLLGGGGAWYLWQRAPAPTVAADDAFDYDRAFDRERLESERAPLWLVRDFAGHTRAEAEIVLGQPWQCAAALESVRCAYANDVEVVYIADRADWLTLRFEYGRYALEPALLNLLGLKAARPDRQDAVSMTWAPLGGWRQLQIVGDDNGALFARIKVSHE